MTVNEAEITNPEKTILEKFSKPEKTILENFSKEEEESEPSQRLD